MSQKVNVTSPVGRIVMGNLYTPRTTDAEGKPLIIKNGPNAGQPRVDYFFALAIPKGTERHWAETPWGAEIWKVGHTAFPNIASSPSFAWKIEDGDSQIPNKKGRKPCDNEGWKGHWILKLSGGFAPKIYQQEGAAFMEIAQKDFVKCGYYVEVAFSVEGNSSQQNAGIYLNHSMICFRGYGPEITFGPDVTAAGFGKSAMPAGASATPIGGTMPPLPAAASVPGIPALAAAPAYQPPAPIQPVTHAAPPVVVHPNPAFLTPGAPAATPVPVPPLPPAPAPVVVARQMTAAAGGVSYEAFIAKGWTDAQLIQNGMMLA